MDIIDGSGLWSCTSVAFIPPPTPTPGGDMTTGGSGGSIRTQTMPQFSDDYLQRLERKRKKRKRNNEILITL